MAQWKLIAYVLCGFLGYAYGCCPYMKKEDWIDKKPFFTKENYADSTCIAEVKAGSFANDDGGSWCQVAGLILQHWCATECKKMTCPTPTSPLNPIRCSGKCDASGNPLITCECGASTPPCNTPQTTWKDIEDFYAKTCIKKSFCNSVTTG